jgi:hypothetical protein
MNVFLRSHIIGRHRACKEAAANLENERILKFQRLCNALNIMDSTGKALVEDNVLGW